MPKHINKYGYLLFFLIIAIPSFFILANTLISNSSSSIYYNPVVPISMTDDEWNNDGYNINLQSPLNGNGKKWTIMFYGAHDNDLPSSIPYIGSNDDVDVLAFEDGRSEGDCKVVYVIEGGRIYLNLTDVDPSWTDELNSGHPDTLISFVLYCIENYPADHYWIVLDNHGGSYNGVCWDDSSVDNLSIEDLKTAFSSITSYLGRKVDGIFFQACLMANLEIAFQLSPFVGYIVAYEPSVGAGGLNLSSDLLVETIKANPSLSPQEIAIELVDEAFISEIGDTLIAAIKLSIIQDLIDDIDNLATQLISNFHIYGKEIKDARDASEGWYGFPYRLVDLIDFLEELYERVPNQLIRYLILEILNTLGPSDQDYAILKYRKGDIRYYMHGISIYFPETLSAYSSYYEEGSDFCALTHWEEFLQVYYENDVSGAITPLGNSYVFFIILGALPLVIIGGRNILFKKR